MAAAALPLVPLPSPRIEKNTNDIITLYPREHYLSRKWKPFAELEAFLQRISKMTLFLTRHDFEIQSHLGAQARGTTWGQLLYEGKYGKVARY